MTKTRRQCILVVVLLLVLQSLAFHCIAQSEPYTKRISCGAEENVKSHNKLWHKDHGYSGGIISTSASRLSIAYPPLRTLRSFPLTTFGMMNCYNFEALPQGHYWVRIFLGDTPRSEIDAEPLFDVSIEGTRIGSLKPGWSDSLEQVFMESLLFINNGTTSICFHNKGYGDPSVLSLEILQVDDKAYEHCDERTILKTVKRVHSGVEFFESEFGRINDTNPWGGDRIWRPVDTVQHDRFDILVSDETRSIENALVGPNFYPQGLYQSAVSTPDFEYKIDVDPNKVYSVWMHFAEIDPMVSSAGQRVFDIKINGDSKFKDIDVFRQSGGAYTAMVLNVTTVAVNTSELAITLHPKNCGRAIISAIEVFEVIVPDSKSSPEEVGALHKLDEHSINELEEPNPGWRKDCT